jgi:hypothetical protein
MMSIIARLRKSASREIGYQLTNEGRATRDIQGYLGHKNMRHTIGFTELGAGRFKVSS